MCASVWNALSASRSTTWGTRGCVVLFGPRGVPAGLRVCPPHTLSPSSNDQHPSPPALVLTAQHAHCPHHRKAQEALLARPQRRPRHGRQRRLCFLVSIRCVSSCFPNLIPSPRYGVHLKHGKQPRRFSVVILLQALIRSVQCKSRRSSTSGSSGPSRANRSTLYRVVHSHNPHLTAPSAHRILPVPARADSIHDYSCGRQ